LKSAKKAAYVLGLLLRRFDLSMDAGKKRIESYVLAQARNAGVPIPTGEIPGEEPDFHFNTKAGALGIELSELLRPASSNHGILPVAEENFHRALVQIAQKEYFSVPEAKLVHVSIYFTNSRGKKGDKRQMAKSLLEFVRAKAHLADPFVASYDVPDGFSSIVISSRTEVDEWWSGECGGFTVDDIRSQLADRISEKNKRLPAYRKNLPNSSRVWLLIYSLVTVSRSMSIPYGIEQWRFPFEFDRIFWFAVLEHNFVEIQKADS
jgi:hypothetical protein